MKVFEKFRILVLICTVFSVFSCQIQSEKSVADNEQTEYDRIYNEQTGDNASSRDLHDNNSHPYWRKMDPVKDGANYYTLDDVAVTLYKTFHTGFEELNSEDGDDKLMIDRPDKNDMVTLRNPDASANLVFPDNGATVTVKKWVFWKCHLEGSAFVINPATGKRYIVNLRLPDPDMHEGDLPYKAKVENVGFRIVDYVDWGFDADPAHGGGLVPWRTVAINLSKYKIPANSWIYLPVMDGKWVPLPKLDDLGRPGEGMWYPGQEVMSQWENIAGKEDKMRRDTHFDWVQHDGFFRATDISWSLPTWMGPDAIKDGKWIDMYVGTQGIMQWIWSAYWNTPFFNSQDKVTDEQGNQHTVDRASVRVHKTVTVPAMLEDGKKPQYRYTENIDSDPFLNTKYYNIDAFGSQLSNNYTALEFGNTYDFNNIENDELLAIKSGKVVKWEEKWGWSSKTFTAKDVVIADINKTDSDYSRADGKENIVLEVDSNDYTYLSFGWSYTNMKRVKIPLSQINISNGSVIREIGVGIAAGDFDGDGKDEIAIRTSRQVGPGAGYINIYDIDNNNVTKKSWVRGITYQFEPFEAGDLDGDGKDEIIYSYGYRYPGASAWSPSTGTITRVVSGGTVKSLVCMSLDSDHKDDIMFSYNNKPGIYRYLSSHNKPYTEPRLVDISRTPKYLSEYNFVAPHK